MNTKLKLFLPFFAIVFAPRDPLRIASAKDIIIAGAAYGTIASGNRFEYTDLLKELCSKMSCNLDIQNVFNSIKNLSENEKEAFLSSLSELSDMKVAVIGFTLLLYQKDINISLNQAIGAAEKFGEYNVPTDVKKYISAISTLKTNSNGVRISDNKKLYAADVVHTLKEAAKSVTGLITDEDEAKIKDIKTERGLDDNKIMTTLTKLIINNKR